MRPAYDARVARLFAKCPRHSACRFCRSRVGEIVFETTDEKGEHSGIVEYFAVLSQCKTVVE
ncbi:hypothetical protein EV192_101783 [Actinocrispum wychmicini]|uniref:Uncharacterized protein n=1 Tax=Actinocrispum wychmicini TaxID=1213861 RepID=A0A4R2K594_9PSEU|nr:hypothetical protein EV192_101783 [Actinocrispum wychmicini]